MKIKLSAILVLSFLILAVGLIIYIVKFDGFKSKSEKEIIGNERDGYLNYGEIIKNKIESEANGYLSYTSFDGSPPTLGDGSSILFGGQDHYQLSGTLNFSVKEDCFVICESGTGCWQNFKCKPMSEIDATVDKLTGDKFIDKLKLTANEKQSINCEITFEKTSEGYKFNHLREF